MIQRLVLTIIILLSCQIAFAANPITDKRQRELQHLVLHDCGSCHGMTLKGGLGPALTSAAIIDKNVAVLSTIISTGVPGKAMPPWKNILTKDEINWISRQLKAGNFTQ